MANDLMLRETEPGPSESEPPPVGPFFTLPVKQSATLREIPSAWIDRLFARLWAWYGKQIEDKWGANVDEAKAIWREDLAGLSQAQLKAGMERLRDTAKFAPSLPEFRQLCLGTGAKVDAEAHWKICLSGRYECLAHYWAVQRYGYFEFHKDAWTQARYRFPALLREAMIEEDSGKLEPMPAHVAERFEWARAA